MKKISVLATLLDVVMFAFTGCEKEESTEKVLLKRQLTSYDGSSKFYFDSDFVNPFDQYGVNHNKLFQKFETIWTEYKKEDKLNAALFDYAIDKSEEITGLCLADAGLDKNEFRQYLCNSLRDKAEYAYLQTVNDFFSQFGIYFFPKFISDVEAFAYKTDNVDEGISQIKIIEQKIYHSKIPTDIKKYYLIFCSVAYHSLLNIERINSDPSSPFYGVPKKGQGHGDAIVADACGAARGAYEGACVGAAGGPAGAVILGAVGAVCVGGLSTAVEVGVKKNTSKWIDSWFD